MGGGSGKAGDSLVDFLDGGDADSIGDSDEEGTTGPYGRAAVKLEEKQGVQQTSSSAGAATLQCYPCKSCPVSCITGFSQLGCCQVQGKQGPQAAPGTKRG